MTEPLKPTAAVDHPTYKVHSSGMPHLDVPEGPPLPPLPDNATPEERIMHALHAVKDPEIPVISVVDLGIVTHVEVDAATGAARVGLTPTFAGCPALRLMQQQVHDTVVALGHAPVEVYTTFEKHWSTEMISARGREAIKNFGLAPPPRHNGNPDLHALVHTACPHCGSEKTTLKSPFGPTLCRSLHYCYECLQAFEQFKPV